MSESQTATEVADDDDEQLVAYLDGELVGQDRRDLEERLVSDEGLRKRLRQLQAGWEMLNYLPNPTPTDDLVRTTLELVVKDLTQSVNPQQPAAVHRRMRWSRWWVSLGAAAIVFWSAAFALQRYRLRLEKEDWVVAMDVDAYSVGDDLDFIRRLGAIESWQAMLSELPSGDADLTIDPSSVVTLTATQFRDKLETLTPQPRAIASTRWDRFQALPPENRQKLHDVADIVAAADDSKELLQTMRLYARWREQLPAETVDEIEAATPEQLTLAIGRGVRESLADIGRVSGDNLSDEAVERIDFTLQEIAQQRINRGDRPTAEFYQWIAKRSFVGDKRQALRATVAAMVFDDFTNRLGRGGWFGQPAGERTRRGESPMPSPPPPLTNGELELIVSMLPASELERFEALPSDEWMRSFIVRQWAEETLRRKFRGKRKSLAETYAELSPAEREVIDLLPPEQSKERLLQRR